MSRTFEVKVLYKDRTEPTVYTGITSYDVRGEYKILCLKKSPLQHYILLDNVVEFSVKELIDKDPQNIQRCY